MDWYWIDGVGHELFPDEMKRERLAVKMLLEAFDLQDSIGLLLADHARRHGVKRLVFESFDRLFPTFPWQMCSKHLYRIQGSLCKLQPPQLVLDWFRRMKVHYQICCRHGVSAGISDGQEQRPLAMVFTASELRGGLIIHEGLPQGGGNYFACQAPLNDGERSSLCIERYDAWLAAVAAQEWEPNSPWKPPVQQTQHLSNPSDVVAPVELWMLHAAGSEKDAILLAAIWGALHQRAMMNRTLPVYRHRGIRCVRITHAELAELLTMSEDQVKRAVRCLRDRGLLWSDQGVLGVTAKARECSQADRGGAASKHVSPETLTSS